MNATTILNKSFTLVIVGALVVLLFKDITWLSNITYFFLWVFSVLGILMLIINKDDIDPAEDVRWEITKAYDSLSDFVIIGLLAATGYFVLAGCWLIAMASVARYKNEGHKKFLAGEES